MTVIVAAIVETGGVVIAADSQITHGWQKRYGSEPKLWVTDKWAMGASGGLREAQVLKHHVTWPRYRPDEDTDWETFLVKTLWPAVRAGAKDHGVVKTELGVETIPLSLIVAAGDKLAELASDGAAIAEVSGRCAIGSGYAEALGHLGDQGVWLEADVIEAARRATRTAKGCDGPISVVNTRSLTVRTVNP